MLYFHLIKMQSDQPLVKKKKKKKKKKKRCPLYLVDGSTGKVKFRMISTSFDFLTGSQTPSGHSCVTFENSIDYQNGFILDLYVTKDARQKWFLIIIIKKNVKNEMLT